MPRPRQVIVVALAVVGWAGVFAGAFAGGRASDAGAAAPADPVVLEDGVPVGVSDTPAGVTAAAADYAADVQRTSALDPEEFARLVSLAYTPAAQTRVLALAREARQGDPPLEGVHLLTAVAAARLAGYSRRAATVDLWLEATYWSAAIAPTQTWALDALGLSWRAGRWQISTQTLGQPPVPAWATIRDGNNTAVAFDRALTGMTDAWYGAPAQ